MQNYKENKKTSLVSLRNLIGIRRDEEGLVVIWEGVSSLPLYF
jgi:hypothetical protein